MAANPNYQPMFEGKPLGKVTNFTTTSIADIWTADANDTQHVNGLVITQTGTASLVAQLNAHDGTTSIPLCTFTVAAYAGTKSDGSVPNVNALAQANLAGPAQVDAAGNKFLELPPGWKLQLTCLTAPTGGSLYTIATGRTLGVAV
jgi:hypothetical protein